MVDRSNDNEGRVQKGWELKADMKTALLELQLGSSTL
ncbi:hypothetical protein TIFTF001_010713 [Ficus carica]|uniref:Uncharacterized protein n=1 Tax=Ficus carica TaxID=3494 RepID=A0AA88AK00_FICCA|nr:hypothetical protein TIFTF001_010713 [Ficus carica]